MGTNKLMMWIAAILLSSAFCAVSALAGVEQPEAYSKLTAVQLQPENVPMLRGGMQNLSGGEGRYTERLPVQLEGPMKKIKKAKYSPRVKKSRAKTIRF